MWAKAFVQSFIEVLPLISAFLMQFKIKEMKGKAVCEWLYKQDSRGVLISQFCKRLWAAFPRKGEGRGLARVAVEEGAGGHWAGADPAWICERVGRAGGSRGRRAEDNLGKQFSAVARCSTQPAGTVAFLPPERVHVCVVVLPTLAWPRSICKHVHTSSCKASS